MLESLWKSGVWRNLRVFTGKREEHVAIIPRFCPIVRQGFGPFQYECLEFGTFEKSLPVIEPSWAIMKKSGTLNAANMTRYPKGLICWKNTLYSMRQVHQNDRWEHKTFSLSDRTVMIEYLSLSIQWEKTSTSIILLFHGISMVKPSSYGDLNLSEYWYHLVIKPYRLKLSILCDDLPSPSILLSQIYSLFPSSLMPEILQAPTTHNQYGRP